MLKDRMWDLSNVVVYSQKVVLFWLFLTHLLRHYSYFQRTSTAKIFRQDPRIGVSFFPTKETLFSHKCISSEVFLSQGFPLPSCVDVCVGSQSEAGIFMADTKQSDPRPETGCQHDAPKRGFLPSTGVLGGGNNLGLPRDDDDVSNLRQSGPRLLAGRLPIAARFKSLKRRAAQYQPRVNIATKISKVWIRCLFCFTKVKRIC